VGPSGRGDGVRLSIAGAPASWGIEPPVPLQDPPWQRVLDEIAGAGYPGTELGPLGYLPQAPTELTEGLRERRLTLAAGFVMAPFSVRAEHAAIDGTVRQTCELLRSGESRTLIVIDALSDDRSATAGRSDAAARLDEAGWAALLDGVRRTAQTADSFGLRATIHAHVGTHVEFEDELERLLADIDGSELGLCVDTGHSTYAGIDPVALLHRHGDRVSYMHFKDIDQGRLATARERRQTFQQAVAAGIFRPLGEGSVDFPAVSAELGRIGYEGWATVEQDRVPDSSATPFQEARRSLQYLRGVGLAA
jgi:inosose dehydratase